MKVKKLLIVGMIGTVALVAIGAKTNAWSYLKTAVSQVRAEVKNNVPTKFELERIRQDIAALDGDISQMIRPIAEHKSVIGRMRKDIAKSQSNVEKQKKTLLEVLSELEENPNAKIVINDKVYTPEQVRKQVLRDTEALKSLEKNVKVQQQVLDAKELSLVATQEQLAKVISKKREYEVRLAQLEAEEATLEIGRIGSDVKFDNSRATQIEEALKAIEIRQDIEKKALEIQQGDLANIPLGDRNRAPASLDSVRAYLEGNEPADKTVSNK